MLGRFLVLIAASIMFLAGCSTTPPKWRAEAVAGLKKINSDGAAAILPAQYRGMKESLALGDRYFSSGETDTAERYFYLALQEAELIEKALPGEKSRIETAQKKLREDTEKRELEARLRVLREEQQRRSTAENKERAIRINAEKLRQVREHVLPVSHTVKRGESLPSIAALPEVFDDSHLWPLLYRANRDQIRDPRHISPGQVLRIPRNVSREEISEAAKYARGKQIQ
jgi:nucleoid-associated protein YgaU